MFDVLLQAANENPPAGDPFLQMLLPMIVIGLFFYFVMLRPQRREQAKRDELLKQLKKNDRVVTIGGILGTIANMSADGKEVTVKVDDNTRIRMLRSSIQSVLTEEPPEESPK
jgi:preprotein translocase subunit YajC